MHQDRMLVVDVNVVVDLALEFTGVPTGQRRTLELICGAIGRRLVLENEDVIIRSVVTKHIVDTARTVLRRKVADEAQVERALGFALKRLLSRSGLYDDTVEDYTVLAKRSWVRYGTDTEDEAIVAAAERHRAAVLTEDKDLRQYLGDRKIAAWSMQSLLAATTANL